VTVKFWAMISLSHDSTADIFALFSDPFACQPRHKVGFRFLILIHGVRKRLVDIIIKIKRWFRDALTTD
jgi:hypothetical protein